MEESCSSVCAVCMCSLSSVCEDALTEGAEGTVLGRVRDGRQKLRRVQTRRKFGFRHGRSVADLLPVLRW